MPSKGKILRVLRSLLAFVLALALLPLVNLAGGELADRFDLAGGGTGRLAWDLGWLLVSVLSSTWLLVKLAPCAPRPHALVWSALLFAMALLAVMRLGEDFPRWFIAGLLPGVPLHAWLGFRLASRYGLAGRT